MEAILRFLLREAKAEPTQSSSTRAFFGLPPSKTHGTSEDPSPPTSSPRGGKRAFLKEHAFFAASQALTDKSNAQDGGISSKQPTESKTVPAAPLSIPAPKATSRHLTAQQDSSSPTELSQASGASTSSLSYDAEAVIDRIRQLSLPSSSLEALVSEECRRFVSSQTEPSGAPPSIRVGDLACFLAKRFPSSRFYLRKVTDSKQYWTKSMTNTFIICTNNAHPQQHILIDPSFKHSFMVGGAMTDRYNAIYSSLPDILIGTSSTLSALLHIICFEAIKMFEIQGKPTPPWRGYNNQIARWHSNACEDTLVSPWPNQGPDQSQGSTTISRQSTLRQQVVKIGATKQDYKLIRGFDVEA